MRYLALVLAVVGAASVAHAQNATPDIKGTWTGKGKVLVFGSNVHNPGTQTMAEAPRVRDIEMTDVVEGQDRLRQVILGRRQDRRAVRLGDLFGQ
jgi:hypothetical protein